MSDTNPPNPLAPPTPELTERIRVRAYFLWQHDGCPVGRDLDYWERARELEAIADHPQAGLEPNPMTHPELERTVEEAVIQENLGEFPDRFTDQGARRMTPMTREEEREAERQG